MMLVLSRKVGEKIYINDNISVMVTEIGENKVRLGISAPSDVPVFRQEVLAKPPARANADGQEGNAAGE